MTTRGGGADADAVLTGLVRMARPAQFGLVLAVFTLGVAIAVARGAAPAPPTVGAGLLALSAATLSVHYANEYADHETDALTDRTAFSGGSGALADLGLSRGVPRRGAVATGALAVSVAALAPLAGAALPPVALALLAAILLLGWGYSVGPALAWHGLGELDNALVGGTLLPLYGVAVAGGRVTTTTALAVAPLGVATFCSLLATTWPDREADAAVGKATLATRWPRGRLRALHAGATAAYLLLVGAVWASSLPSSVAFASLLPTPLLLWGVATYTRRRSPLPNVAAMVAVVAAQSVAWTWLAVG